MALTFTGGIDLPKFAFSELKRIKKYDDPPYTVTDFSQERDMEFIPSVSEGDAVARYMQTGELVYKGDAVPVYSGVSGVVREYLRDRNGAVCGMVTDTDGAGRQTELHGYSGTLEELTPEILTDLIKRAGITCRGAKRFAYKKIIDANNNTERFFLNCCESEPGVSSRKALLYEDTEAVLNGAKLLMRALDVRRCEIVIEKNSGEILQKLKSLTRRDPLFDVRRVKPKYPQDEEFSVICAVSGVRLSDAAKPERSKCTVFDAETASAVFRAVAFGIPQCERVVTVDTENVLCPIGTPISDLVTFAGITFDSARHIIAGGIMRGRALKSSDEPVSSETDAVTVVYHGDGRRIPEMTECTRCGKCVSVCPSRIMPYYLAELSRKKKYSLCKQYGAAACTECGCCDYVCPSYIPVKKLISAAKQKLPEDVSE